MFGSFGLDLVSGMFGFTCSTHFLLLPVLWVLFTTQMHGVLPWHLVFDCCGFVHEPVWSEPIRPNNMLTRQEFIFFA